MQIVVSDEEKNLAATPLWIAVAVLVLALALLGFFVYRGASSSALAVSGLLVLLGVGGIAAALRMRSDRGAVGGAHLRVGMQPRIGGPLSAVLIMPRVAEGAKALEARLVLREFRYGRNGEVLDEKQLWEHSASFPVRIGPTSSDAEIEMTIPADLAPADDPGWNSPAVTPGTRYRRWRLEVLVPYGGQGLRRTYNIGVKAK